MVTGRIAEKSELGCTVVSEKIRFHCAQMPSTSLGHQVGNMGESTLLSARHDLSHGVILFEFSTSPTSANTSTPPATFLTSGHPRKPEPTNNLTHLKVGASLKADE